MAPLGTLLIHEVGVGLGVQGSTKGKCRMLQRCPIRPNMHECCMFDSSSGIIHVETASFLPSHHTHMYSQVPCYVGCHPQVEHFPPHILANLLTPHIPCEYITQHLQKNRIGHWVVSCHILVSFLYTIE